MSENLHRNTPIMGWASWNCFRTDITEEKLKEQMDALISTGLAECGYEYANMDDGFFGGRGEDGILKIHKERFPNGIKVIADYAHKLGLKAGTYSEGGKTSCGYYYDHEGENGTDVGLYGHEEQDLKMYLEDCGFDFIKVDWCGGLKEGVDEKEQYTKIGKIIEEIRQRTGRCIVYNICCKFFPGEWALDIADSWRTGSDILPRFDSVVKQIDNIKPLRKYCAPGHVNDLDMMQIGNGLTHEEEKSHFAMWCMMSTPLMIGCDLTKIDEATLEILKNKELIAVNQDSACLQAYVVKEYRSDNDVLLGEVWIKNLGRDNSNEKAIAFLNRSEEPLEMSIEWETAGLRGDILSLRDLWKHKDIDHKENMTLTVRPHETVVFRVKSQKAGVAADINAELEYHEPEPVKQITIDKARELVENGALLIDVRTNTEYNEKHLEGAINVPYTELHAHISGTVPDKNAKCIVYCSKGKRSAQAKYTMDHMGYKRVYYLGGVTDLNI